MIRLITLAAAAAFIALPASAQSPSIRISTTGKSVEQVKREVFKAAEQLCARETVGASFPIDEQRTCLKNTMRTTLAQSSDPALQLASR